jgi:hypothetical protein
LCFSCLLMYNCNISDLLYSFPVFEDNEILLRYPSLPYPTRYPRTPIIPSNLEVAKFYRMQIQENFNYTRNSSVKTHTRTPRNATIASLTKHSQHFREFSAL